MIRVGMLVFLFIIAVELGLITHFLDVQTRIIVEQNNTTLTDLLKKLQ